MKKYESKLKNLNTIEEISLEDYRFFKRMQDCDKHPIINWATITTGVSTLFMTGLILLAVFIPNFAGVFMSALIMPACGLGIGIGSAACMNRYYEDVEERREYFALKKSKQLERITNLMNEFEASEHFDILSKEDRLAELNERTQEIAKELENEKAMAQNREKQLQDEDTLIRKMIARVNATDPKDLKEISNYELAEEINADAGEQISITE